ncbi:MAG: four helix bundle protein [Candidatus Dojkabacteria bacterium]
MKIRAFEELEIWKTSASLAVRIYNITNKQKFNRDFGLRDQIRRAVVSVSSNIAEGFEKNNNKEFVRYLLISKGSIGEVRSQLYIAEQLDYITEEEYNTLKKESLIISSKIKALINYLKTQLG